MKVSLKWLQEYVSVPDSVGEFCDRLDLTGTGVEGVETLGAALDGVVIGYVRSCEPHPDSDHMSVTLVDIGAEEPLQVVCGAPNIRADIKVPVATVGAMLSGDFKIKKAKKRGVVSFGMNCSQRELGLGGDGEGIWILPEDAPVGMPIAEYAGLSDTVLDLEVTPNRPDQLSIVGMAREVGAMYHVPYTNPLAEMEAQLDALSADTKAADCVTVSIEEAKRCPRYSARVIENVTVGPSPDWLVKRIEAVGVRSINNVVDVTNYILFLFGQPLHAFDFDVLAGEEAQAHIVVRAARDNEKLTTLDGQDRILNEDMTVIATNTEAVALAGVMGGAQSEVTPATTRVLLEAATFEPGRTSRTSRSLGLFSESSMRYERRVDDVDIERISAAAAALIAQLSGGRVLQGVVDEYPCPTVREVLNFRINRFNRMMGATISAQEISTILRDLGCEVSAGEQEDTLSVLPPSFRPDLEREIDLYEEVLRIYGMDRIDTTLPAGRERVGYITPAQKTEKLISNVMRSCGLNETVTYSFVNAEDIARLRLPLPETELPVVLLNPLSAEQAVMRQSIIPGLLRSVAYNINHGVKNVQLYEMGMCFSAAAGKKKPKERKKLAFVCAGAMHDTTWNEPARAFDFFDAKGIIETLLRELAVPKIRFKALEADAAGHLQPGRAAQISAAGAELGWIGEIHPLVARDFDIEGSVVACELDVDTLVKVARDARPFEEIPAFPAVLMDVAFVVDETVSHEKMMQVITSAGGKLLESAQLFDVYRDKERLGSKKSMAYALSYRALDRTLKSDEVDKAHDRLVRKVCGATGAEVRG